MLQRKKLSTTIGASNYAYLRNMVKAGRAESVGQAVDKAVETARSACGKLVWLFSARLTRTRRQRET